MLQYLFELFLVFIISTNKNFVGISLAVYYSYGFGLSVLLTVGGGMTGVVVFTYFGEWLMNFLKRWYDVEKKIDHFRSKNKFTKFLISGYGLSAVAVLTPVLLSVPLGSFMAITMEKSRTRIFLFMLGGLLFWSVLLLGTSHLLGLNPRVWVKELLGIR